MKEPIQEYLLEIEKLQEEIYKLQASYTEVKSNYNLLLQKIKEYQKENEKYKKLLKEQSQNIVILTAALNDKKEGRI